MAALANDIEMSFTDTDISTLYIVQHEMQKNPDVEFVGVIVKHPLTGECRMRISSKSSAEQNMSEAVDAAIRSASEMRDTMNTDVRV